MAIRLMLALAASAFSLASPASATIQFFTSKAAFEAATANRGVDSFNELVYDARGESELRAAGDYFYTASASEVALYGAVDGTGFLSTASILDILRLDSFSGNITAIGGVIFGSDFDGLFTAEAGLDLVVETANEQRSEAIFNLTRSSFFGFTAPTPITALSIAVRQAPPSEVWVSLDDLTLGQAAGVAVVPEPASWAMLFAGFGLVGVTMRRRRIIRAAA